MIWRNFIGRLYEFALFELSDPRFGVGCCGLFVDFVVFEQQVADGLDLKLLALQLLPK